MGQEKGEHSAMSNLYVKWNSFGGVGAIKEDYRAERGLLFIENLMRDVRFALRVLRKSPGFTAVAVVTLAMAIGANATVFSVMNALILRPLNVPEAERLYQLFRGKDKAGNQSFPDYLDLRDRNRSFDDLVGYGATEAGLDTGANPSSARRRSGHSNRDLSRTRSDGVRQLLSS